MLVVGKGRGRNINNDRLIYINVDDSPAPIPELRRLLDINQGWLYQQWSGQLRSQGKTKEAREAAAKVTRYMPSAGAQLTLGLLDYELGDKPSALADFRKAIELDPSVRKQFDGTGGQQAGGRGGQRMRTILDDKEFLAQVLK
jgi:tetratricopeptide (TPR) repeat protein